MTANELQNYLKRDSLTLQEVAQIIYELKNDCVGRGEIGNRYECGFYNGEVNAFYICIDLLSKLEE